MQGVNDMSDLEDEGKAIARMFAIGQCRLAHPE